MTHLDKFRLYIESTHSMGEERRNALMRFVEERLPEFIRQNGYPDFGDSFSRMDEAFWASVVTDGLPNTTDEERRYAQMVMGSIRYIRKFIQFDKSANYDKLLNERLKREKKTPHADNSKPEPEGLPRQEGMPTQVCVTHYERNAEDRLKVLERDCYTCQVCGMRFDERYGEIGKDFIEVHHLYPVCNMGENYQFDPMDREKGLVCLCSNCHSMIHRGGHWEEIDGERRMVPMTLRELQELYSTHKGQ